VIGATETVPDGILLLDKPQGMTSHDVVARARRALGTKKVGHAGTLDPMATGLLILGIGPSTRLLTYLVGLDKEYFATIRLGQSTTTDDAEGDVLATSDITAVTSTALAAGMEVLTGDISQRPSAVRAIKVDGVRAYDRVRAGEDVELAARAVRVSAFELLEGCGGPFDSASPRSGTQLHGFIDVDVRVECSSGTYIRALARDLGASLSTGGHLTALRRTRVGPFSIEDAEPVPDRVPARSDDSRTLERAETSATGANAGEPHPLRAALLQPAAVAALLFPTVQLDAKQSADLANGKRVLVGHENAPTVAALAPNGRLIGLIAIEDGRTRVLTNFPTESA
jgi:tRNA pseudouridine55 synthase